MDVGDVLVILLELGVVWLELELVVDVLVGTGDGEGDEYSSSASREYRIWCLDATYDGCCEEQRWERYCLRIFFGFDLGVSLGV